MSTPISTPELCPACGTLALPFAAAIVCDSCLFAAEVARQTSAPAQSARPPVLPEFIDPRYEDAPRGADAFKKGGPYSDSPYKRGGP